MARGPNQAVFRSRIQKTRESPPGGGLSGALWFGVERL